MPKNASEEDYGIDGIGIVSPIVFTNPESKFSVSLNQNIVIKTGQLLTVTGGSSSGKTLFLELILGLVTIKSGRINISSKSKSPWEYIRYFDQKDTFMRVGDSFSFYKERLAQLSIFFNNSELCVLVIDDPLLGSDAVMREEILGFIKKSLDNRAIIICACNDKQLVDLSSIWLAIQMDGTVLVKKDASKLL